MQVNIKFDTEKESVDDLKRLVASLQDLINQREKAPSSAPVHANKPQAFVSQPAQQVQQANASKQTHTTGGGRIMEYDPAVGDLLSKFASGR